MSEAIVDVDDLIIYRTDGISTGGVRESVLLPLKSVKGELIRCKDCEHYWESAKMCTNTGNPLSDYCEPIDFCSRAERAEE